MADAKQQKIDENASTQERVHLERAMQLGDDQKDAVRRSEAAEKAHNEGDAYDEAKALADGKIDLGVDGKNPVSFFNPHPRAVMNRDDEDHQRGKFAGVAKADPRNARADEARAENKTTADTDKSK